MTLFEELLLRELLLLIEATNSLSPAPEERWFRSDLNAIGDRIPEGSEDAKNNP